MTRINVGILPKELSNKHLIAEHREIKRIPNCISKGKYNMDGQPDRFKLGVYIEVLMYKIILVLGITFLMN